MAAFSDFLELRLLEASLTEGKTYVKPHTVRIGTFVDTDTYTVTINGTDFQDTATGGETENDVLTALQTAINGGSEPVTASVFTDLDGNDALKIEQDSSFAPFVVAVSTSGTSTMTDNQEIYVALYTADPTDADAGTEVSGTNYTREIGVFTTPSSPGGTMSNDADVQFNTAGAGGWGTISHVGIHDDISAGNLLYHGSLTTSKTVSENDSFVFRAGDLTVTLA